ncbi:TPA: Dam family site-specific DNA-(adenine-N6)-methyltransferase [Candidatus Woesearchaeota archaeon]|nr:Dam family site-specific DNA-(adenine-N6)-methyltransferase [Candidatus Woesearchaeota archaeon]
MRVAELETIKIGPFLKWAGGKTQLLNQFDDHLPQEITCYVEPFLGGGAVLIHILQTRRPKRAFAYDINEDLINTYNQIKDHPELLSVALEMLEREHNTSKDKGIFFYDRREEFNTDIRSKIRKAALFIYLNKSCFNGLFRVNSLGNFNVPFGKYEKISLPTFEHILLLSRLFENVTFEKKDFRAVKYPKNCTVYFDPPYWAEPKVNGFTGYHKDDFTDEDQRALAEKFAALTTSGRKLFLSNSNTQFISRLYDEFEQVHVDARWMINCNGEGRKALKELFIKYP